jgi:hypothetical protein
MAEPCRRKLQAPTGLSCSCRTRTLLLRLTLPCPLFERATVPRLGVGVRTPCQVSGRSHSGPVGWAGCGGLWFVGEREEDRVVGHGSPGSFHVRSAGLARVSPRFSLRSPICTAWQVGSHRAFRRIPHDGVKLVRLGRVDSWNGPTPSRGRRHRPGAGQQRRRSLRDHSGGPNEEVHHIDHVVSRDLVEPPRVLYRLLAGQAPFGRSRGDFDGRRVDNLDTGR